MPQYTRSELALLVLASALTLGGTQSALADTSASSSSNSRSSSPSSSNPGPGLQEINLPAGPLATALNTLARQSGLTLAADPSLLAGHSVAALSGHFSVQQALNTLLAGTGLQARQTAANSYSIVQGDPDSLPPVEVSASYIPTDQLPAPYAGGQVARGGRLGLLGETDIMDAPFSITSYTEQTIEDQQARSIADVLANEPSVRAASARTNINEDFTIRGLAVPSQDVALNGMYGLMPYFRVPIEMAERIEVLKGPSALLNGMPPSGSIGGSVNVVPKRATDTPLTRLTLEYLSDSIAGAHVDVGRRFGDNNAFGVRFNGMLRGGDSTVDYQEEDDELFTLGLDYQGERLRASADFIYQQQETQGMVRQFTLGPGVTDLPDAADGNVNYPGSWTDLEMEDSSGVLRIEYDINDRVTVYAGGGTRSSSMDALAGNPMLINNDGDYMYGPAWQIFNVDSVSYEAGFNMVFNTGSISHQLNLGATRVDQDEEIFFDFTSFAPGTGNLYESDNSRSVSTAGMQSNTVPWEDTTLTSYALADTLGFFEDRLKVTLGLRHQQVELQNYSFVTGDPTTEPYDESEVTPVVGVVYKPQEEISLYANYIEGLSPGPRAPVGVPTANIPPFESKQTEIGAKADWGQFGGSIALYEIKQPGGELVGTLFVSNEQRLRGTELSVFGNPVDNVRLLGGLSWIDSELTETSNADNRGNHAVGVPELQLNLGGEWDTPFFSGFTLTARAIYTGEQYVDPANNLEVDPWTRLDLGARYRTRMMDKPLVLRLNLENALNENYWGVATAGYLHTGDARTLLMSASVDL
ncbi:TonB-dependent receptor [Ketobacter sp.]|uniref:TonB-dependent receptor n=1 Tax=Ketobacter sp. TaxID=2083498 RepID=UPI000F2A27B3|nr:TonB-dependent receptor [Ketobacter sp.]RLU00151.1 MAG: TonB-dependent receptor [Ketobacter sp.]